MKYTLKEQNPHGTSDKNLVTAVVIWSYNIDKTLFMYISGSN